MPTAAKLFAGICLAVLGYAVSEIIKTNMPASTRFGIFSEVNAVIGFLCGWLIVGSRAGRGQSAAIANGFTGTVALVLWALFIHSANLMVENSLDRKYRTVMEAIMGIFESAVKYAQELQDVTVITTLLVGAIITGFVAEVVSRHWR